MSKDIVQIDYQQINQLVQRFAKQQTQVQAILQSLKQSIKSLENGGWLGEAASACFNEFHGVVVPAYTRLDHVLSESQICLNQLAKIFHEAEAEASALLRGELAQVVGSSSPRQLQTNPRTTRSDQPSRFQAQSLTETIETLDAQSFEINSVLATIKQALPAERQAILQNPDLLKRIRDSAGDQAYLVMSALLAGSLNWLESAHDPNGCILISWKDQSTYAPVYKTNNFAQWICAEPDPKNPSIPIPPPNPLTASMNCWESLLFAAFLGENISYEALDAIYSEVGTPITLADHKQSIYTALGGERSVEWKPGIDIPAGSVVFFQTETDQISHVAYATGNEIDKSPELISLWDEPNNITTVQFTTIAELKGADYSITFTPDPWLNDQ